ALDLAREMACDNTVTVRLLLTPSGEFQWIGIEPFLSAEHAVTEAAAGLDLIELQLAVAEGRRFPNQVPEIRGHAIGALLYADNAAGTDSARRSLHVWNPPRETGDLRIETGVQEGTAPLDPLLAGFVCSDPVRDGAIRKLSQALKDLWVEGVRNNRE